MTAPQITREELDDQLKEVRDRRKYADSRLRQQYLELDAAYRAQAEELRIVKEKARAVVEKLQDEYVIEEDGSESCQFCSYRGDAHAATCELAALAAVVGEK